MPLAGLLRHYPAGRFTRQSMRTLGPAPNRPSFLQDNLGHGAHSSDASAVSSDGNGNAAAAAGTATIGRGRCNVQSAEDSRQTAATAANKRTCCSSSSRGSVGKRQQRRVQGCPMPGPFFPHLLWACSQRCAIGRSDHPKRTGGRKEKG